MTETIKEHDFIEVEYTGRTADDNMVFDTTSEEVAKSEDLGGGHARWGPIIICVGEAQLLKGIDDQLVGKELGKEYEIRLSPEQAFGKKSAKLIQLVNTAKFRKQEINPMPGLQVNIDGMTGVIKTITGGRTMVDFNHPLASRELAYTVKIGRRVDDDREKAESLLKMLFADAKCELSEGILTVTSKVKLPKEVLTVVEKRVTKLVPAVKSITFGK
jgi:FKBP-type peptidyl-prolyl cis-trans isomerase 2